MDTMFAQYQLSKLVVFQITFARTSRQAFRGTWGRADDIG
jgi:hypothetical protein